MANNAPIGVFDSGMGGLSVWRELRRSLPDESLLYFGDGKNCPYGDKPAEEVLGYVCSAVERLIHDGVKLIVIACNAATAAAIAHLRAHYSIPFVGMEPAVKPAALTTRSGVVGILATRAALDGELFHRTAGFYADRVKLITAVGENFVELVEADAEESPEARQCVERVLAPMLDAGADRIVLGCTHYPFLTGVMRKVIGTRDVELIDPAPAVVRRVKSLLTQFDSVADGTQPVSCRFLTVADETYAMRLRDKAMRCTGLPTSVSIDK